MKYLQSPRDVLLMELNDEQVLVTAVDSCGGIGREPHDALDADPVLAGNYTARVALMEVLSVGAEPVSVSLSVSSSPRVAEFLIKGVKQILPDCPLVISTEKNTPTSMTAFGVTIVGICRTLKTAQAHTGDALYCAGLPLVGEDVLKNKESICTIPCLKTLLECPQVYGIIPVGSRGIAVEANVLSAENGLKCQLNAVPELDFAQSSGPSTCVVFAASPTGFAVDLPLPISRIGYLA